MIVKDLITKLNKFDQNLDVLLYCEDLEDGQKSVLFEIDHISVSNIERHRDKNHKPAVRFQKSNTSEAVLIIELISDI